MHNWRLTGKPTRPMISESSGQPWLEGRGMRGPQGLFETELKGDSSWTTVSSAPLAVPPSPCSSRPRSARLPVGMRIRRRRSLLPHRPRTRCSRAPASDQLKRPRCRSRRRRTIPHEQEHLAVTAFAARYVESPGIRPGLFIFAGYFSAPALSTSRGSRKAIFPASKRDRAERLSAPLPLCAAYALPRRKAICK